MNCPGCNGKMVFRNSSGTIFKRIGRTIVVGALGAVAGPPGVLIGAGIGAVEKVRKTQRTGSAKNVVILNTSKEINDSNSQA